MCGEVSNSRIAYCDGFKFTNLFAIGSILEQVKTREFRGCVWGTKFTSKDSRTDPLDNVNFAAVRGKLTRAKLGAKKAVLGGRCLLMSRYIAQKESAHFIGVVLHYVDRKPFIFKAIALPYRHAKIIDVCSGIDKVAKEISQCDMVLSSSLHGLAVADSYGIPNAWIKTSDRVLSEDFKFTDYYSTCGIENPRPYDLSLCKSQKAPRKSLHAREPREIEHLKDQLIGVFPGELIP